MASPQSHNYLLSRRKSLALSQADMAYLLGAGSGGVPSRHEQQLREPSLATALAYEVIHKRTPSELFPDLYRKVEQEVMARARTLSERTDDRTSNRAAHRRRILGEIAGKEITTLKK